jgi:hypothetical protein
MLWDMILYNTIFPHRQSPNFWGGASAGRRWKIKRSPFKAFFGSKRSQSIIEHKEPRILFERFKFWNRILGATSLKFPQLFGFFPVPAQPPVSCVNGIGVIGGPCSLAFKTIPFWVIRSALKMIAWRKTKVYEATSDLLVLNVGNGWVAGGCWDDDITSDYGSFPHSQAQVRWDANLCHELWHVLCSMEHIHSG